VLDGGAGTDTLRLYGNGSDITSNGGRFAPAAGFSAQDTRQTDDLNGFENLSGSIHDDALTGDAGPTCWPATHGSDVLQGRRRRDLLLGDGA
jgi:hypothetical protein